MQKWEYKYVPLTFEVWKDRFKAWKEGKESQATIITILNRLGEEGWKLVSIHWGEDGIQAILKRPKLS